MKNKDDVLQAFTQTIFLTFSTLRVSFYPKEVDAKRPFSPKVAYGQLPVLLLSHHKPL